VFDPILGLDLSCPGPQSLCGTFDCKVSSSPIIVRVNSSIDTIALVQTRKEGASKRGGKHRRGRLEFQLEFVVVESLLHENNGFYSSSYK